MAIYAALLMCLPARPASCVQTAIVCSPCLQQAVAKVLTLASRGCLAGELSPVLAWALCIGLAGSCLDITAANFGREITLLYAFGLFLGTIYSVPPLRRANSGNCGNTCI